MVERYRFDKPKPDGPVSVYAGERLAATILKPDDAEPKVQFIGVTSFSAIMEMWEQFATWKPAAFWLSWWHEEGMGGFELRWPWWFTGTRCADDAESVCAAIRAATPEDAKEAVMAAYDERPERIEWRFCQARPDDWSPCGDRFPKARWMEW